MDNTTNHSASNEHTSTSSPRCLYDTLASAIRKGAEDARRAADEAAPKIKAAASEAAYWTAYGTTFAAVFQWDILKHFTPETVKAGCRDGVKAAKAAADRWCAPKRSDLPPLIDQGIPTSPQSSGSV